MKPFATALVLTLALSLVTAPVVAQGIDMGSLTPVLTYPEPKPVPVTKDTSGIDK